MPRPTYASVACTWFASSSCTSSLRFVPTGTGQGTQKKNRSAAQVETDLKARHHFPAEPNINRHEAASRSSVLEQRPVPGLTLTACQGIFGLMPDTLESAAPVRRRRSDAQRNIDAII